MADATRNLTVYEVRCDRCDVTFPPGTRECVHCGGRIGRPRLLPGRGADEMPDFAGGDPYLEPHDADEAEPQSGGRFLRIGFTLVWIVLAFASAAVRACREG